MLSGQPHEDPHEHEKRRQAHTGGQIQSHAEAAAKRENSEQEAGRPAARGYASDKVGEQARGGKPALALEANRDGQQQALMGRDNSRRITRTCGARKGGVWKQGEQPKGTTLALEALA